MSKSPTLAEYGRAAATIRTELRLAEKRRRFWAWAGAHIDGDPVPLMKEMQSILGDSAASTTRNDFNVHLITERAALQARQDTADERCQSLVEELMRSATSGSYSKAVAVAQRYNKGRAYVSQVCSAVKDPLLDGRVVRYVWDWDGVLAAVDRMLDDWPASTPVTFKAVAARIPGTLRQEVSDVPMSGATLYTQLRYNYPNTFQAVTNAAKATAVSRRIDDGNRTQAYKERMMREGCVAHQALLADLKAAIGRWNEGTPTQPLMTLRPLYKKYKIAGRDLRALLRYLDPELWKQLTRIGAKWSEHRDETVARYRTTMTSTEIAAKLGVSADLVRILKRKKTGRQSLRKVNIQWEGLKDSDDVLANFADDLAEVEALHRKGATCRPLTVVKCAAEAWDIVPRYVGHAITYHDPELWARYRAMHDAYIKAREEDVATSDASAPVLAERWECSTNTIKEIRKKCSAK